MRAKRKANLDIAAGTREERGPGLRLQSKAKELKIKKKANLDIAAGTREERGPGLRLQSQAKVNQLQKEKKANLDIAAGTREERGPGRRLQSQARRKQGANGRPGHRCGDSGGARTRAASRKQWMRDLNNEEAEEMIKDAPWAVKIGARKAWNTAVKMQLEEESQEPSTRLVHPVFWMKEGGVGKFHQGILPTQNQEQEAILAVEEPGGEDILRKFGEP